MNPVIIHLSIQCKDIFKKKNKCFIHMKHQEVLRKNLVLPIEKFPSLVHPRNAIMLQHLYYLIFNPLTVKWWLFWDVEKKVEENLKLLALNVVMVTYDGCWLTRGPVWSPI